MSSRARLIVPVLVFLLICLLEDSQCGAARQRARHRRLFRGESELGQVWLWSSRIETRNAKGKLINCVGVGVARGRGPKMWKFTLHYAKFRLSIA